MSVRFIPILLFVFITSQSFSQAIQQLDRDINHPSYNSIYPAVSGDGRVMLFMTDYSDDGDFAMMMSKYRAGNWQKPEDADIIGSAKVNNWGGYSLNYDGTAVYFSSRRSNGLGKYDLWTAQYKNGEWSRPTNVGKPVNSGNNEGNPSVSPDGQRIYFMRCESMSNSDVSGCKLYYSDSGPRGWQEPVLMPDDINIGNTTSPRILPDNKTLVFASDRPGGKGKVDLWMTKRTGDHWSAPLNIESVNTPNNDYFLSVTMRSIAYLTTVSDRGKKAISELRLPSEYRLENVIVQQGTIRDEEGNGLAAEVRAYNLDTESYEARLRLNSSDENYVIILPEGAVYDVAYTEMRQNKMYHSVQVDARDLVAPRREYPNIVLYDLNVGLTIELTGVNFEPFSSDLSKGYELEFSRLSKLLNQHPQLKVEIGTYQKVYQENSMQVNRDLSESRIDTAYVFEKAIRVDTLDNGEKDELILDINNLLAGTLADTTLAYTYLARMAAIDSVQVQKLTTTYHNNRSQTQAERVKEELIKDGISSDRIVAVGYRDVNPPIDYKNEQERMVVIKFLNGTDD